MPQEKKTEEKKTQEKPFDITKKRFKVRLERQLPGEENAQYVCNGARGVQVKRGVDVMVPFAVREAIRMSEDAKQKMYRFLEVQDDEMEKMNAKLRG